MQGLPPPTKERSTPPGEGTASKSKVLMMFTSTQGTQIILVLKGVGKEGLRELLKENLYRFRGVKRFFSWGFPIIFLGGSPPINHTGPSLVQSNKTL